MKTDHTRTLAKDTLEVFKWILFIPFFIVYAAARAACDFGALHSQGKAKQLFERGADRLQAMK
jgi:hypothetical protein